MSWAGQFPTTYLRRSHIELSGIPNDIQEDNLEKVVIDICHDPMWKSSQKTLRDAIVYQFLNRVGTLIKELQ